ncbi:hypothetical protein TanjilG_04829 [Lupinus angustifolius]|uniref:Uncharacterized protein n=1 Tax=Lupinus angustifolius TaxID=3871 RepID=A0A4P1QSD0_LUPAN|nr:PREDICTED: uncharacterized protein LOC109332821 [Lupinus angustifolius]OIV93597.1 hypothetical protein TanjilG_04829 [Lupinus angustifolius]
MFRSMTSRRGYERLGKESSTITLLNDEFKRSTSLASQAPSFSRRVTSSSRASSSSTFGNISLQRNPTKKGNNDKKKIHPLLSFLDFGRKKKTTAKPEFSRYLEYLKEGGIWDLNSNKPVIYYK